MDIRRGLARLGIVAAVTLLTVLGVLTYRASQEQAEAALSVAHTHSVIQALQRVVSGVAESESALRAYAIMRQNTFLTDFEPGIQSAQEGFANARELAAGNHSLERVLQSLEPLLSERVTQLRSRKAALDANAVAHVSEDAQRVSALIRSIVHHAINTERDQLQIRTDIAATRALRARQTTLLGVLASLALVVGAAVAADQQTRRRLLTEQTRLRELNLVLELGELLQACRTLDEAYEVMKRLGPEFMEGAAGAVSVFQSSRNAVVVRAAWGAKPFPGLTTFEPDQCWGLRRGQLHVLEKSRHGMTCDHFQQPPQGSACLPLIAHGELIGALHLASGSGFGPHLRERMGVFGEQIALAIANLQLREKLRNQSIRDALTGLFNRRFSEETLQREVARATREQTTLSVIMLDVDHFKKFNDCYGHEVGDDVLRSIGQMLLRQTRGGDVACRLGGEELMILMPGSALDATRSRADYLRRCVSELNIRAQGKAVDQVTVSIGVATFPQHGHSPEELMRSADAALYRAKREGRNCVICAE